MLRPSLALLLCAGLAASGPAQAPAPKAAEAAPVDAYVGATLVNSTGAAAVPDSVVLVREGRILAAGPAKRVKVPKGAAVTDLRGKWIIPGLIDAHVHFFQSGGLYTRPDSLDLRKAVPYEAELARTKAGLDRTFARYLRCGITGVVDCGGPMWNFEVRERAAKTLLAPRVAVAGPLISTYQPAALTTDDPPILKISTPEEAQALVRKEAEKKPDFIKIWYIVSPRLGLSVESGRPIVRAAIEESHKLGLRAAVHATQLETAKAAVEEGADILVHSVDDLELDAAFIAQLKARRVLYIPTLIVSPDYSMAFSQQVKVDPAELELGDPFQLGSLFDLRHLDPVPERAAAAMRAAKPVTLQPAALANLRRLQAAGVAVAAGTDAGNIGTLHGPSLFREFRAMAQAGLSSQEILTDATLRGAEVMGRASELGSIEPGKRADLVVLDADPLEDIGNTARIRLVVKDGRALAPDRILQETPEELVQRQVDAYNLRDIDAFIAAYAPGAKLHLGLEADARTIPIEARREDFAKRLAECPQLHVQILQRMVSGGRIVDQERITGLPNGGTKEGIVIYQIQDGRIAECWLFH